jgi:HD-GYP domain-containing protein (c-di-GMP phosphodiesterase class II)
VKLIGISCALHDIGKVGVPDSVLLKPGPLTDEERSQVQLHAAVGGDCIREIELRLGGSNFLQMAREIAYSHHERWDGSGYPYGRSGEDIPLAARIVAIADVYDSLSTTRVYKPPYPHEKCVSFIRDESGKHFDPRLVDVFLRMEAEFHQISRQFADGIAEITTPAQRRQESSAPSAVSSEAASLLEDAEEPLHSLQEHPQTRLPEATSALSTDSR